MFTCVIIDSNGRDTPVTVPTLSVDAIVAEAVQIAPPDSVLLLMATQDGGYVPLYKTTFPTDPKITPVVFMSVMGTPYFLRLVKDLLSLGQLVVVPSDEAFNEETAAAVLSDNNKVVLENFFLKHTGSFDAKKEEVVFRSGVTGQVHDYDMTIGTQTFPILGPFYYNGQSFFTYAQRSFYNALSAK
jgi:hypothetical protein